MVQGLWRSRQWYLWYRSGRWFLRRPLLRSSKMSKEISMKKSSRMTIVHPHAAGVDIGAEFHIFAVPPDADTEPVRTFQSFTGNLQRMSDWLKPVTLWPLPWSLPAFTDCLLLKSLKQLGSRWSSLMQETQKMFPVARPMSTMPSGSRSCIHLVFSVPVSDLGTTFLYSGLIWGNGNAWLNTGLRILNIYRRCWCRWMCNYIILYRISLALPVFQSSELSSVVSAILQYWSSIVMWNLKRRQKYFGRHWQETGSLSIFLHLNSRLHFSIFTRKRSANVMLKSKPHYCSSVPELKSRKGYCPPPGIVQSNPISFPLMSDHYSGKLRGQIWHRYMGSDLIRH